MFKPNIASMSRFAVLSPLIFLAALIASQAVCAPSTEVDIPVPTGVDSEGSLLVSGSVAAGQDLNFELYYRPDSSTVVKVGDKIQLNSKVSAVAGNYFIKFYLMIEPIQIKPGEQLEIKLGSLNAGQAAHTQSQVSIDLTNAKMQDILLQTVPLIINMDNNASASCRPKIAAADKVACAAFASGDYHQYRDALVKFLPPGQYAVWSFATHSWDSNDYSPTISNVSLGGPLTVFPGVYRIEFENWITRKSVSKTGLVVD